MKTILKLILLTVVVGYMLFAMIKFMSMDDVQPCRGLIVRIADTDEGVEALIDSTDVALMLHRGGIRPDSMMIGDISLMAVDSILLCNPYIASVTSYKNAMDNLCVEITGFTPVLRVMNEDGTTYYLDSNGVRLPINGNELSVPIVTGHVNLKWGATHLPRLVSQLYADDFWLEEIEQIYVNRDSTVTLVPHRGDHLIRLGRVENIRDKMSRLRTFYDQGLDKVGWNRYKTINLEYDNQIICTKKK
ncbi:MAG: cell division protein FtsQ [Bacteroidaceae bacterium]|nr:cell division protein FtsQ [Bacteroidaceae bacterium]